MVQPFSPSFCGKRTTKSRTKSLQRQKGNFWIYIQTRLQDIRSPSGATTGFTNNRYSPTKAWNIIIDLQRRHQYTTNCERRVSCLSRLRIIYNIFVSDIGYRIQVLPSVPSNVVLKAHGSSVYKPRDAFSKRTSESYSLGISNLFPVI